MLFCSVTLNKINLCTYTLFIKMSENKPNSPGQPNSNYPLSAQEHEKLLDRIKNVYPRDIDLVEFVQQRSYGYQLDAKSSTKQAIVLQKRNQEGISLDTIIVRKNKETQQWYYTNPNDSRDKGPIWKFVMNRLGTTSYLKIDQHLSEYSNLENLREREPQIKRVQINSSSIENRSALVVKHYNLEPLSNMEYLKSRGIAEMVLNSYEFQGRVLNENNKGFSNTVFPMYNRDGEIIGIERKNFAYNSNKDFGGAAEGSNKADSIWYSKIWPDKKIDKFVLGETPIDLISYHQLKNKASVENNVYIGSNGYWTKNQIGIVQDLIQKHQPHSVILANDNDNSGKRFNISLIGQLNRPISKEDMALNPLSSFQPQPLITKDNKLTVDCDLESKFVVRLRFNSVFENQYEGIKIFKNIEDKLSDIRNISSQPVNSRVSEISDKKGVYEVTFVNATLELQKAQKLVLELRGMDNYLAVDKARSKDFNEDLKISLGLQKDDSIKENAQEVKLTPDEINKANSFDLSKELPNSKELDRRSGMGR